MRVRSLVAVAAVLLSLPALGCGSGASTTHGASDTSGTTGGGDPAPASPLAITGPNETWSWVDVDGAYCGDGNPTGLVVNLTDRSKNAVIFLMGGGACWDYQSCYVSGLASYLPVGFTETDMPFLTIMTSAVGLVDRDDVNNPFRDYSVIAVPYCTGDAFTGTNVAVYEGHATHHVGHNNVMAYLKRIVPTFPGADRIILVGVSAGGIGAAANWWNTQQAFAQARPQVAGAAPVPRVDLIDDSGTALPSPYLSTTLSNTWRAAWGIDDGLPPGCTECKVELAALVDWSATNVPNSRAAFMSYTADSVLPGFYDITEAQFTEGLGVLAKTRMDGHANVRYFFEEASDHVLMPHPALTQNGVRLWDWLPQMVQDDPSWASVHP